MILISAFVGGFTNNQSATEGNKRFIPYEMLKRLAIRFINLKQYKC
jgi:hypothetical protein